MNFANTISTRSSHSTRPSTLVSLRAPYFSGEKGRYCWAHCSAVGGGKRKREKDGKEQGHPPRPAWPTSGCSPRKPHRSPRSGHQDSGSQSQPPPSQSPHNHYKNENAHGPLRQRDQSAPHHHPTRGLTKPEAPASRPSGRMGGGSPPSEACPPSRTHTSRTSSPSSKP